MNGTHWGTIAVGVGGIATAGALLISLTLLGMQIGEQRRVRADRHREHASCVALWLELEAVDACEPGIVEVRAHITNTSNRPAMDVTGEVGIELGLWEAAEEEDGEEVRDVIDTWKAAAIGPASQIERVFKLERLPPSVTRLVEQWQVPCVIGELAFTDASGVEWIKTGRGELMERESRKWAGILAYSLTERDDKLTRRSQPWMRPVPGLRGWLLGRTVTRLRTASGLRRRLLVLASRPLAYTGRERPRRYGR